MSTPRTVNTPLPATVLLALGDADDRAAAAELLGADGHAVRSASTAEEALRLLGVNGTPPALAVLGAGLPGLPPGELLQRLRERAGMADLPLLWLDARSAPAPEDAFEEGAAPDLTLRGPLDPEALRAAVRTLLRLRAASELLRLATEASEGMVYEWNPTTRQVSRSPELERIVGVSPAEADPGDSWWLDRIHPDDRGAMWAAIQAALAGGEHYSAEYRVRADDGAYRHVWDRGLIVRAPDGAVSRVVGNTVDVTGRKQAELAQQASEERLRFALDAGRIGAWEWNVRSGRVSWSEGLERLHGLEPGVFDGTYEAFMALVHPDERERLVAAIQCTLETGAPYSLEFRALKGDGSLQWIATQAQLFRDAEGQPDRLVGVSRDITVEKLADLARQESEEKFRTIVEAANEGIWLLNAAARVTFVNPRMADMLGFTPEEMLGRHKQDFVFEEDRPAVEALVERRRAGISEQVDLRFRHRDGREVWALMVARPLFGASGEFRGILDLLTDITERKQAEEALREENRRKTEFLAMLAHELRNPLAPIINAVEILRVRDAADPIARKQRDVIARNARHLARLVDDLLEVSRINEGKIALRRVRVELAEVVEQAVTSARVLIEERRHRLAVSVPPEPLVLEADPTRLVQVLVNLLNNAAKYTPEGGEISLSASREDGEAVVRVRDNGVGMNPDLQERVFDLFVQGERNLARTEGGLGVGLTLSRRLVELHGGTISARSDGPGRGSEFTVRLPTSDFGFWILDLPNSPDRGSERAHAAAQQPAPADGPLEARQNPKSKIQNPKSTRVLVVEDNRDAAATLADLLELWGCEARVAHDGPAALAAAAEFRPDVILLDIGLPGLDGYQVARRLRESPGLGSARLVALSGYGDLEHRRRAEAAGFHHHLTKPVEPEALRRLLACAGLPA
jgi:PAS domain S-box-containing protein